MRVRWFVRIDSQRMRENNATQRGMQLLLAREARGHCRSYGHRVTVPREQWKRDSYGGNARWSR